MKCLGKVKVKVKLGGPLSLLCLASAGAATVKSVKTVMETVHENKRHKTAMKNIERINETMKKAEDMLSKIHIKDENVADDVEKTDE